VENEEKTKELNSSGFRWSGQTVFKGSIKSGEEAALHLECQIADYGTFDLNQWRLILGDGVDFFVQLPTVPCLISVVSNKGKQ
jgi:hypothetical protein